ncbi:MAG: AEC family transporter [Candidatus Marinimicrobia bacterium]|nr:AEC family transporter [Candidatus Neomarinimicrobiota bacterium]MBL7011164.1 AEC family transporter [Candidatus Neomarinimicrobiota bacterium]MBL7031312.1 AEC family transporter [Candidatus Neomarinimicrobiota bacterium]
MIIISALLPVFGLIVLGYFLRYFALKNLLFWRRAEQLTYYILFPSLLISKLALNDDAETTFLPIIISLYLMLVVGSILTFIAWKIIHFDRPVFTSVFQGSIRFNSYIGLAVAGQLFGEKGIAVAAVIIGLLIPIINIICVIILAFFNPKKRLNLQNTLGYIFRNPLILACAIGTSLNISGIGLPGDFNQILSSLGKLAVTFGLLTVGAGLKLRLITQSMEAVISSTFIRLILLPVFVFLITDLFQIDIVTRSVLILFSGLPTASSGYILARQMGGDAEVMAVIISVQSSMAAVTLPVLLFFTA